MYNNNIDVTNSELKNIFKRLDIDKDNQVTFHEFKRLFNNEITNETKNKKNKNQSNSNKFFSNSFNTDKYNSFNNSKENNQEKIKGNSNSFSKENNVKDDNISYEEENFISFLKELIELENDLEKAKIDLTYKSDFNAEDAFRNFEIDGRGYITELDLNYGLNEFDVFVPKEEVKLLMKRYDIKNERFLR
jgi:Ca2+-binding EF-hand superfamily protein